MKTHAINKQTILVDLTTSKKSTNEQHREVRRTANAHFWESEDGMIDDGYGKFFGNNLLNVYHIGSVKKGIWIVSLKQMRPDQTRPIAAKYLNVDLNLH